MSDLKTIAVPSPSLTRKITAPVKRTKLEEILEREAKKDELLRKFAEQANEINLAITATFREVDTRFAEIDGVAIGETKESVDAYKDKLDNNDETVATTITGQFEEAKTLTNELEELGVGAEEDNKYTVWSISTLEDLSNEVTEAIKARQVDFEEERKRIIEAEERMRAFADAAEECVEFATKETEEITTLASSGDVTEALEKVEARWNDGQEVKDRITKLGELEQAVRDLGIVGNRFTELSCLEIRTEHLSQLTSSVELQIENLRAVRELIQALLKDAETLSAWVKETAPRFSEDADLGASLQDVMNTVKAFRTYRSSEKPTNTRLFSAIGQLKTVVDRVLTNQNRPAFSYPEEIGDIDPAWEELTQSEDSYEIRLQEELRRQQEIMNLVQRFFADSKELMEWIVAKDQFMNKEKHIENSNKGYTRSLIAQMNTFDAEVTDREADLKSLESLGNEISGLNYSDFVEVNRVFEDLIDGWASLQGADVGTSLVQPSGESGGSSKKKSDSPEPQTSELSEPEPA